MEISCCLFPFKFLSKFNFWHDEDSRSEFQFERAKEEAESRGKADSKLNLRSQSITDGLRNTLNSCPIPEVELEFMTGPKECPSSINDPPTSIQSAHYLFLKLVKNLSTLNVQAIVVCCFSDHPLVAMIRHEFKDIICMHIMDSSITAALSSSSKPFSILTTGSDMVPDIDTGVLNYMGGNSTRYAGCFATNLGVLELANSSSQEKVQTVIKQRIHKISQKEVGAIILGCAGFAGKESMIKSCLIENQSVKVKPTPSVLQTVLKQEFIY